MLRLMLTDELWSKLRKIMLQHRIYDKPNLRMIVEAMLYRMRVGCPWRDLPAEFGCWNSIYQKFNRWSSKGKLIRVMTVKTLGILFVKKHLFPLSQERVILKLAIQTWIGVFINIDIWLKIYSLE